MRDITSNIKTFFTRCYNEDDSIPYAWYNTQYCLLTKEQKQKLFSYLVKNDFIKYMFIVDNIEVVRPQRTWGNTPEWFRPASMWHTFHNIPVNNSFIFLMYNNEWGNDIKVAKLKKAIIDSFPNKCDIIIYFKNTLQVRDMEENLWKVEFI